MNKKLLFGLVFMFLLVMSSAVADISTHGFTLGSTVSKTALRGMQVSCDVDVTLDFINKKTANTATHAYIYSDSGNNPNSLLASSTFSGNNASFSYLLENGTKYWLMMDANGGTYTSTFTGSISLPVTDNGCTWYRFDEVGGPNSNNAAVDVLSFTFTPVPVSEVFSIQAQDYWDNSTLDEFKTNVSVPDDYLVSYWNFNGNANDIIGGNDGTVNGATLTTGKFEQGYGQNADGQYIELADETVMNGWEEFTFNFYINLTGTSDTDGIIGFGNSGNRQLFVWYDTQNGGELRAMIENSTGDTTEVNYPMSELGMYNFTLRYEQGNYSIFSNGEYYESVEFYGGLIDITGLSARFGQLPGFDSIKGIYDDFKLYNRSLSDEEIFTIQNLAPRFLHNLNARTTNSSIVFNETYDQSGNNRTLTNNGATYDNGAVNTTGAYLTGEKIPFSQTSQYTICIEVRPEFLANNFVFSQYGSSPSNRSALIYQISNDWRFYIGDSNFVRAENVIVPNEIQNVCGVATSTNKLIYVNGVLINNQTHGIGSFTDGTNLFVGSDESGSSNFEGLFNWAKVWFEDLTPTQIAQEQNETVYNWDNLVAYYPFQRISDNTTVNATIYKDNYLVSDQYQEYDTNTNPLTGRLSQSQISLNAQAIVTNSTISPANFTIDGQTFTDGQTINITAGDYNVTFSKSGWYNKTQQITILPDASQSFTITDVYDGQLNLTYLDAQTNATVNTYTLTVENSTYSQEYEVTNESSYIVNLLQNIDYDIIFTKSGYFSKTFNHFANQSFENISTVVTQIGDIQINVFDLNTTNLMSTNVTLLVQNSTTEETYSIQNGTGFIESLQQGQQYNLQFSAVGYVTNNYVFTYTNQSSINLYLNQGQTDITFITQDSASSPLNDVEVKIERFVNGTYTVISLGETDIIGTYIANLQTGLTHRITFTKDNYITQSFITQLSELSYTVTLQTQTVFDIAQGLQTVKTSFSPTNNTLYPNTVAFEINITNEDFNFEYYYARLKYNGTVLVSDNNTDAQGGTLNFNYNLSAFNNTGLPLVLEYGYFGKDAGLIISYHTYAVSSDENYSGSFLQLRDKLAVSLSILEKLSIFAFVFIVLLLMFSTMTTGLVNVIISSGIALLVGWIVGINLIILIIIFVLSTFIMLAYGSNRI